MPGKQGKLPKSRNRTYWTKARVLAGLALFAKTNGFAPTGTEQYHSLVKGTGMTVHRDFPSAYSVLRYFPTFREAWAAAGVLTDRLHEAWTADEEWYLREAVGILSRAEIAQDLRRSEGAVKRRMYDLGVDARDRWGWTPHRIEEHLQIPGARIATLMERGELPYFRGKFLIYIDPADLIGLEGITWRRATSEIKDAARKSLMERAAKIIAGVDWRQGRIYKVNPVWRKKHARKAPRPTKPPFTLRRKDIVAVRRSREGRSLRPGRRGVVHLMYWVGYKSNNSAPGWFVRVEFKKEQRHGRPSKRVTYSLPLEAVQKVRRLPGDPALKSPGHSSARIASAALANRRRAGEHIARSTKEALVRERLRHEKRESRRAKIASITDGVYRGRSPRKLTGHGRGWRGPKAA